jgi:hypothetical protein
VLIVIAVVCGTIDNSQSGTGQAEIDTRIQVVKLQLDPEEPTILAPSEKIHNEQPPAPTQQVPTELSQPPTIKSIPNILPPGFLAVIQRSQNTNIQQATTNNTTDNNVKPVAATIASSAPPFHGAMKPGQSVVYILDCSGSMGEFGKLGLAQSALIATLRRQPDTFRFQVIPYNSTARFLIPGGLATISASLGQAEARLARLEAVGRSNHADAVRAATDLRPDVIVWLTDADDLSIAKFKQILSGAGKPIPIFLAEVTARGVGTPLELR